MRYSKFVVTSAIGAQEELRLEFASSDRACLVEKQHVQRACRLDAEQFANQYICLLVVENKI